MYLFGLWILQLNIKLQQAKQHIAQSLDRTKQVFERLFPTGASKDIDYEQWLDQLAAHIEQKQRESASTNTNNINHSSGNATHKSAVTITNHVNHKSNSTQSNDSPPAKHGDDLILENAKLQATVEQYKVIVTDTVSNKSTRLFAAITLYLIISYLY